MILEVSQQSCYQSVKDKKFESNSQRLNIIKAQSECCYQSVKDKKFESNSQPLLGSLDQMRI